MDTFVFTCTILSACLCIIGLLGNSLTVVILRSFRNKMALFYLLLALAAADAALLLFTFLGAVIPRLCHFHGDEVCSRKMTWHDQTWLWQMTCLAQTSGTWLLTAITIDRYLAISRPLDARKTHRSKWIVLSVAAIFLASVLFTTPRFFHHFPLWNTDSPGDVYEESNTTSAIHDAAIFVPNPIIEDLSDDHNYSAQSSKYEPKPKRHAMPDFEVANSSGQSIKRYNLEFTEKNSDSSGQFTDSSGHDKQEDKNPEAVSLFFDDEDYSSIDPGKDIGDTSGSGDLYGNALDWEPADRDVSALHETVNVVTWHTEYAVRLERAKLTLTLPCGEPPPNGDYIHVVFRLCHNFWYRVVYFWGLTWLLVFVGPLSILTTLNILLIREIRRANLHHAILTHSETGNAKENINVTLNVVAIVSVFLVCQSLDFGIIVLQTWRPGWLGDIHVLRLSAAAHTLMTLNASVNFIIYSMFYGKFRERVFAVLRSVIPRIQRDSGNTSSSNNTASGKKITLEESM